MGDYTILIEPDCHWKVAPRPTAATPMDSPYCSCRLTWLTAAVPMDSPYCSCKLTRFRSQLGEQDPAAFAQSLVRGPPTTWTIVVVAAVVVLVLVVDG